MIAPCTHYPAATRAFAADLAPVPPAMRSPLPTNASLEAEVELLRAIIAKQRKALESVYQEVAPDRGMDQPLSRASQLPPPIIFEVVDALVDSRLTA